MTDSTDDVDWYDGPEQDYDCQRCQQAREDLKEAVERKTYCPRCHEAMYP